MIKRKNNKLNLNILGFSNIFLAVRLFKTKNEKNHKNIITDFQRFSKMLYHCCTYPKYEKLIVLYINDLQDCFTLLHVMCIDLFFIQFPYSFH